MPAPPRRGPNELTDGAARALLEQLAGFWRVTGRSFDAAGQQNAELAGSATYAWALGGQFLAGEQILTDGSEMLQWADFLGFNPVTQSFSRTLFSDRDPANYCATGLWNDRSRLLVFVTDPVLGPDGQERRIRSILDLSDPSRPQWEMVYLVGSGLAERSVGSVQLLLRRGVPQGTPGPSGPLIPGVPGQATPAPGSSAARRDQGLPQRGPMSPAQVQQRLDSVLQQRQQMQQQIEEMRRQMREMSGTIRRITQP